MKAKLETKMGDDRVPARQHERWLDTPFLSRALDAVLRLAEIYAGERRIQTDGNRADRVATPHADPIAPIDTPAAVSAADSLRPAQPLGGVEQSSLETPAPDVQAKNGRRGGWTKGNSTSAQIRAGAVEYLREKGTRATGREIWEALKAKGLVLNTKDPAALVSSRIGRSPLFDHTWEGYGLREWSNGAGPL